MNVELFYQTLPIMLKGMLGVFIVTAVLIGAVAILGAVSRSGKKS